MTSPADRKAFNAALIEEFRANGGKVGGRFAGRDRLYARQVETAPIFGEYQQKTTRLIPVIALERKG